MKSWKNNKETLTISDYIISLCSFIPLAGLLFAVISIVFGIEKKSRTLIFLGCGGILFTIILYSSLYYYGFKSENSYDSWNVFTKNNLNKGFIYIEFYKTQNGEYPDSLNYLKNYDTFIQITDTPKGNEFFYKKISDSAYYFFGLGKDEKAFTSDDIYPELSNAILKQNGLIKR